MVQRQTLIYLVIFAGCGKTTTELSRDGLPPKVARLVAGLEPMLAECPERVWLSASAHFHQSQVLFISNVEGQAFLWNDQVGGRHTPPRITAVDVASLEASWRSPSFTTGDFHGAPTLAVNLDQPEDLALSLALHEGFHALSGQAAWPFTRQGARETPYPEDWRPWYERSQLEHSLHAVALSDGQDSLGAAAHWLGQFAADAADRKEELRTTDVLEGSAQFATVMGLALADVGCAAGESTLRRAALRKLDTISVPELSYPLGAAAGVTLRRLGTVGWQNAIEHGQAPADVLLAKVTPQPQGDDAAAMQAAQLEVEARNAATANELEPLLARTQSPDFARLVLDQRLVRGAMTLSGYYRLTHVPGHLRALNDVSATFVISMTGAALQLEAYSVLQGVPNPCESMSETAYTVAIPKSALTQAADGVSSSLRNVAFMKVKVTERVDEQGLSWLCLN